MCVFRSDIDLVVIGKWDELPLRALENELLEKGIADQSSIKVLDKATVSFLLLRFQQCHCHL
jgi:non-canonical poly(A) RNA polymerase PAPD5/7